MNIIELVLDEENNEIGIEAISVVENPAIEENFLALKSNIVELKEADKEKKLLVGALLIPNKPIYRRSGDEEYYIYFSKDTVEKASQMYLMNGNQNNATLEHQHDIVGLTLVESWIVEDEVHDKSRKFGMDAAELTSDCCSETRRSLGLALSRRVRVRTLGRTGG